MLLRLSVADMVHMHLYVSCLFALSMFLLGTSFWLSFSRKSAILMPLYPAPMMPWLRTNGVNTNGAAAKVMNFDRLEKKVRPGTFGKSNID